MSQKSKSKGREGLIPILFEFAVQRVGRFYSKLLQPHNFFPKFFCFLWFFSCFYYHWPGGKKREFDVKNLILKQTRKKVGSERKCEETSRGYVSTHLALWFQLVYLLGYVSDGRCCTGKFYLLFLQNQA